MRKIIGPDVSFYQNKPGTPQGINFVRLNQVSDFVIVRVGQNIWTDSDFKDNWRRAKDAGLPRGSYWFFDSRVDPKQQAELWVDLLGNDLGELPLFADLEEDYGGAFNGWKNWKQFLERVKTLVGKKEIGIYTAYYYWLQNSPDPTTQISDLEYFHRYPLWIANYNVDQPLVPKPWAANEWLFWQYTSKGPGASYGVESNEIDLNYFNGDARSFSQRFGVPQPDENPLPPDDAVGIRYSINAASLSARAGPGTNYKTIGNFLRNDIVESLESNTTGSWIRVRRISDGLTGWCSATYLIRITTPPPPPPPPVDQTGDRYRVTATSLNVREGPGTNFKLLGVVELNEVVIAISTNADKSWRQIRRMDGLVGWVSAKYLVLMPTTPPQPPADESAGDWYRVTLARLNVREEPNPTSKIVGFLSKNEAVVALSINADKTWVRFRRVDGLIAWASKTYLVNLGKAPASVMQKIFNGVTYYRNESLSPRRVVSHILTIDLRIEGIRCLVTPPIRKNLPQLCTRKTSQFLTDFGMKIAINGDGFYYLNPSEFNPQNYCPNGGDPIRLVGYAASRGKVYSEKELGRPILYINQRNEISFDKPKGDVYNALSGDRMLVVKGKKVSGLNASSFDPRTALGINQNGRWLYLVVVDGREFSEGVNFPELADILLSFGAYTGISLDGGGSSTMVIEGIDGSPRILNTLIDEGVPGRERAVANHLGITFKSQK